jgi:hypothetical protein
MSTVDTIAIDFDGVLSAYTRWKGYLAPFDPPVEGALDAIRSYQDAAFKVCIFTSRADSLKQIERIEQWLAEYGLEGRRIRAIEITNRKPPAIIYLDDRAWLFTGTFPTPQQISEFKTWQKY